MKHPPPTATIEIAEIDDRRALTEPEEDDDNGPPPVCPKCSYEQPAEFAARPRTYGPMPVDICVNCAEFMTYDMRLDDAEERFRDPRSPGMHTPTPVLTTNDDFRRFSPKTCKQLLEAQSITHRLARMRGYHLGKLKMRSGRA
jgi:hypothetical protein